jgi:DNA-binding transcriptional MerR regulator
VRRGKEGFKMPGIPNKLYFRIGEVAKLIGVEPYVLRYWESEFTDIKPSKSKSGQRLYKRRDVELLLKIKELLYEERYTINGAKKRLKDLGKISAPDLPEDFEPEERIPAPRQLEAFPEARDKGEAQGKAEALDHKGVKTLQKIRRDLASLLEIVRD